MLEYTPKFTKLGPKKKKVLKTKRFLNHNIEPPEKSHCRKCGRTTGTECFRHLETFRKFEVGKGWAVKCDDHYSFWGCSDCDEEMSIKPDKTNELAVMTHAEEWNWLIIKTWIDK